MPRPGPVAALLAALAASACAPHGPPPASPAPHLDADPTWQRLTQSLPGKWRAKTPHGSTVDVSYALLSGGSALVETYGSGAHQTVTVFYRDHGDLWLTHYCAQGNEPRLRAVTATPDDVVLRFVDATNVSPDQGVMIERRLHLSAGAFDLTETYRQPSGPPEVTTLHFEPAPQFADWAAARAALLVAHDSDQAGRRELVEMETDAQSRGVEADPERVNALWTRINEQDAKNEAMLDVVVRELGWPVRSQVGEEGTVTAFLIVQHAPHDRQLVYLPMLRDAVAHGEANPQNLALLEDRVNLADGKKQVYGSQVTTKGGVTLENVEDPDHIDDRRKSVGLGPICEYLSLFVAQAGPVTWPPCIAKPAPPAPKRGSRAK